MRLRFLTRVCYIYFQDKDDGPQTRLSRPVPAAGDQDRLGRARGGRTWRRPLAGPQAIPRPPRRPRATCRAGPPPGAGQPRRWRDWAEAGLLARLTAAGGVYSAAPRRTSRGERIPTIERVTPAVEAVASSTSTSTGTGGMITKLRAARRASEAGVPCAIIPGEPGMLPRLLAGEDAGTLVLAQGGRRGLRRRWVLDLKARGEILGDAAAR